MLLSTFEKTFLVICPSGVDIIGKGMPTCINATVESQDPRELMDFL